MPVGSSPTFLLSVDLLATVSFSLYCTPSLFSYFCHLFFFFISPTPCCFSSSSALVFLCFCPVVTLLSFPLPCLRTASGQFCEHRVTLLEALRVRGPLPTEKLLWRMRGKYKAEKCGNHGNGYYKIEKMSLWWIHLMASKS